MHSDANGISWEAGKQTRCALPWSLDSEFITFVLYYYTRKILLLFGTSLIIMKKIAVLLEFNYEDLEVTIG